MTFGRLPLLTHSQLETAIFVAYFSFEAVNILKFSDPFRTIATFHLDESENFTTDEMCDAILRFRAKSREAEQQAFKDSFCEFMQDSNWHQFVDFAKHKELRGLLNDPTSSASEPRPEKLLLVQLK